MNKYLLFRILGNDLYGLHGENQTYNNLKFTLKYEPEFKYTDKIFLLNRIYNKKKLESYIKLLKQYNKKYILHKFDIEKFNSIDSNNKNDLYQNLYKYNLYLINNNGSRNFCINYGIKHNYKWIFPLDSNSFFTSKMFNDIINKINNDTKYIIIPQVRLSNENMNNEELIGKSTITFKNTFEPQIAFRNDCLILFNKKIPYGYSPKAELLRVLKINGVWKSWKNAAIDFGIKDRNSINEPCQTLSYVIRLNPFNINNDYKKNKNNRINGLKNLINRIKKENLIIENFTNLKKTNNNKLLYLIILIIIFIIILNF